MADNTIFLGKADKREELFLPVANRHGLVTGATGIVNDTSVWVFYWPSSARAASKAFMRSRRAAS